MILISVTLVLDKDLCMGVTRPMMVSSVGHKHWLETRQRWIVWIMWHSLKQSNSPWDLKVNAWKNYISIPKKMLYKPYTFYFSESLYTAYAYRVCSNNSVWAEKADYSECLHLITNIPMSNEVRTSPKMAYSCDLSKMATSEDSLQVKS